MLWDIHLTRSLTKSIFIGQLPSSMGKYGSHDLRQDAHLQGLYFQTLSFSERLCTKYRSCLYYKSIRSAYQVRILLQSSWLWTNCCHDEKLQESGGSSHCSSGRQFYFTGAATRHSVKLWCHAWELEKSSPKEESRSLHQERGVKTRRKCVMSLISTTCISIYHRKMKQTQLIFLV